MLSEAGGGNLSAVRQRTDMKPMEGREGEATQPSAISRRRLLVRGTAVAAGAGALVWAAPAVRSVQTGAAAGSLGPNTAGTTVPEQAPAGKPTPTAASTPGRETVAAPDGASLPLTGGDIATLTVIGTTSVVAGGLLLRAQQGMQGTPPLR